MTCPESFRNHFWDYSMASFYGIRICMKCGLHEKTKKKKYD
jgi:hypothetical protein